MLCTTRDHLEWQAQELRREMRNIAPGLSTYKKLESELANIHKRIKDSYPPSSSVDKQKSVV
jgi:hypothetical protein